MHTARIAIFVVGIAGIASGISRSSANDKNEAFQLESRRAGLRGLDPVSIGVDLSPEAQKLGLSEDVLRTKAELRLRSLGIRVFDRQSTPILLMEVDAMPAGDGLYAGSLRLELLDQVYAIRRGKVIDCQGVLWRTSGYAVFNTGKVDDFARHLSDMIDEFANDMLASNEATESAASLPE